MNLSMSFKSYIIQNCIKRIKLFIRSTVKFCDHEVLSENEILKCLLSFSKLYMNPMIFNMYYVNYYTRNYMYI